MLNPNIFLFSSEGAGGGGGEGGDGFLLEVLRKCFYRVEILV